ncbi:hypothetical protein LOZ65_001350 [Ophidiomyces ophidiicola]|nr:hypothetical protein LOZ65_001350 [Ophidiomyces ophidiicola]
MAAPAQPGEQSLEMLTAMVNQTLIETGRFFRSSGSLQSRAQLKRNFPDVHEQYQSALDALSEQIFIAKAFLEKDYEAIVAKRANLRGTRPQAAPPEDGRKDSPVKESPVGQASSASSSQNPSESTATLADTAPLTSTVSPTPATTKQALSTTPTTTNAGSALSLPPTNPAPPPTAIKQEPPSTVAPSEQDAEKAPPDINLSSPDLNMTGAEGQSLPAENPLDFGGAFGPILPGLETYAMAGTDEAAMDLSGADQHAPEFSAIKNEPGDTTDSLIKPHMPAHEGARVDISMEDVPHAESTFDDLFIGSAHFATDGDDLLLQGEDIGDLDDSWFS